MPGVFHKVDGRWQLATVPASPSALRLNPMRVAAHDAATPIPDAESCLLVRVDGQDRWAMIVAADSQVLHNGTAVPAGLRVLDHRDALALPGVPPAFFTTEESARVAPFAGDTPVACPRCRDTVRTGDAAVRCPSCGVVHHEVPERNCWTYAETCALCAQPTALDAGLRWTPEQL